MSFLFSIFIFVLSFMLGVPRVYCYLFALSSAIGKKIVKKEKTTLMSFGCMNVSLGISLNWMTSWQVMKLTYFEVKKCLLRICLDI